jgi:cysteine desulfurase/selenocysteine lyase
VESEKTNFPFFKAHPALVYLDNAATTHKPYPVLDALNHFYTAMNSNMHRGIYQLAEEATEQFEKTRVQVADFVGARDSSEIIFTSGATAALNMVAYGWGDRNIGEGEEVVVTELEHHANFVPWQQLCERKKARLRVIPVKSDGTLDSSSLDSFITPKTKMLAVTHVSNAVGTVVDLAPLIAKAHSVGARVLVDGCQAVSFMPVDVQTLNCDFYVFSGHKIMAPTGVGVLYARQEVHGEFFPSLMGGGMVLEVSSTKTTFLKPPRCYEAGTPPAAEVAGLSAALSYLESVGGSEKVGKYVASLTKKAIEGLSKLPRIRLLGPVDQLEQSGHLISFVVEGMHAHDVAAYLDLRGICVRAGHHCAQPLAKALAYEASVRASFYLYTTHADVAVLIEAVTNLVS